MNPHLFSLRQYLKQNESLWHILPYDLREFTDVNVYRKSTSKYFPRNTDKRLLQAAIIISREKKRIAFHTKGYDYIEGLNLQNTHPKLYRLLKRFKVHTIHELANFIPALRLKAASQIRLKYPEALLLICWWDSIGKNISREHLVPPGNSSGNT